MATSVRANARFGKLVVLRFDHRDRRSRSWWLCRCDCGNTAVVRQDTLVRARGNHSCGCVRAGAGRKHGYYGSPTYQSWRAMRRRCNDPKFIAYPFYGALGVRVCDEWNDARTGFEAFLRDMGERPAGTTLDRRDARGNYEPGNCWWAPRAWQDFNRRGAADLAEDAREYAHWEAEEAAYLAGSHG